MKLPTFLVGLLAGHQVTAAALKDHSNPQPFKINLSKEVPHLFKLVNQTHLPASEEYPGVGGSFGMDLGVLKDLKEEWGSEFDWKTQEESLNTYDQYTVNIEGLTVHFIHIKSGEPNAIPLILNHGWPGSFLEFIHVVEPLTTLAKTSSGKLISFDVVVPSLPGFAFSSTPPMNWTVDDTARVFNTLMTDVLGYETFAVHGTDWGSGIAYSLYENFNTTVRALHLNFLPFSPPTPEQLAADNITLTSDEEFEEQRGVDWSSIGNAYFLEQTTKPNTIGLALYDNPVGQLAWLAEKFIEWSDPRAGTPPSTITHAEILLHVSVYYLTRSFVSSIYIYAQNPNGFKSVYAPALNDAPLLYSSFKYNLALWPRQLVERVGNLVSYQYHDFGGHFPALDNPPALIDDLREIGMYWS